MPFIVVQHQGDTAMSASGMVMTVLEAEVAESNWPKLEAAYAERTRQLPPGLVQTFLVQSTAERPLWRILSVWEGRQALEEMRSSGETPGGILIFRAAGAEPRLTAFRVARHAQREGYAGSLPVGGAG
jgi:hypothetical protein